MGRSAPTLEPGRIGFCGLVTILAAAWSYSGLRPDGTCRYGLAGARRPLGRLRSPFMAASL